MAQQKQWVLFSCCFGILIRKSFEILPRRRVGHILPDLPADLGIFIQDLVTRKAFVYAIKTVEQTSHVANATCKAQSTANDRLESARHSES